MTSIETLVKRAVEIIPDNTAEPRIIRTNNLGKFKQNNQLWMSLFTFEYNPCIYPTPSPEPGFWASPNFTSLGIIMKV